MIGTGDTAGKKNKTLMEENMKKLLVVLSSAAVAMLGFASSGFAFHDGGAAECNGCHTMHNSYNGATIDPLTTQYQAGPYLLKANDQSSACLNCHEAEPGKYHVSAPLKSDVATTELNVTPGGDFAWLVIGTIAANQESRGHNIQAADFGYTYDDGTAPGGIYESSNLACSSCHDPHGKYRYDAAGTLFKGTEASFPPIASSGSYGALPAAGEAVGAYRILGGAGYHPASAINAGMPAFANNPPIAQAPSTYNLSETDLSTGQVRVAYGSGMSEWCSNCHGSMHDAALYASGAAGLVHPAGNEDVLTAAVAANYDSYLGTGDMSGAGDSYWTLVPFEMGVDTRDTAGLAIMNSAVTAKVTGPTVGAANVMCLSCHRVHASAFDSMLRWDNDQAFITEDGATYKSAPNGLTQAQTVMGYNGIPANSFGVAQRSLCNKCHAKD